MYSHVTLLGRFTAQPQLRVTPTGLSVCSFNLAINRRPNGNGEKAVDFIDCVAFGKAAENIAKYMDKGRLILLNGRLQTRTWEGQDGLKRKSTEIVVDDFTFLPDSKKQRESHDDIFDEE